MIKQIINTRTIVTLGLVVGLMFVFYLIIKTKTVESSYQGTFSAIYESERYEKIMNQIDSEQLVVVVGNNYDGLTYFVEGYMERVDNFGKQRVKYKNPSVYIDLEWELQQQQQNGRGFELESKYQQAKQQSEIDNLNEMTKTSIWIINLRDTIQTTSLIRYINILQFKYFNSRFIVISNQNIPSLKSFKHIIYPKPSGLQLKQGILKIEPSWDIVCINNLIQYYENRVDKIAEIVEKGEVQTFHLKYTSLQNQYEGMKRLGYDWIMKQICKKGEISQQQIKQRRIKKYQFSLMIGLQQNEDKYYWSSEEALLIYSMNSRMSCVSSKYKHYNKVDHLKFLIAESQSSLNINKVKTQSNKQNSNRIKSVSEQQKNKKQLLERIVNRKSNQQIVKQETSRQRQVQGRNRENSTFNTKRVKLSSNKQNRITKIHLMQVKYSKKLKQKQRRKNSRTNVDNHNKNNQIKEIIHKEL